MKKIFYILLLTFTTQGLAQDPQLLENTWFLQKVVIDDVDYLPTLRGELDISPDYFQVGHSLCKDYYWGPVFFEGSTLFNLDDNPLLLLGVCIDPFYTDFMDKHYSIYFVNAGLAKNPFNYAIENMGGGIKTLTITNNEGNLAIYGNQELAIRDRELPEIKISPNPVHDVLNISLSQGEIIETKIYTVSGNEIFTQKGNRQELNLQKLSSGIYFLRISTDKGETTKKIIKK